MTETEYYVALSERRVRIITPNSNTAKIIIFQNAADCAACQVGRIATRDFIDVLPAFYADDKIGYDSMGQMVFVLCNQF